MHNTFFPRSQITFGIRLSIFHTQFKKLMSYLTFFNIPKGEKKIDTILYLECNLKKSNCSH